MNMDTGSYGAGIGTGIAIGMAQVLEEEDEHRRKSHQGDDQILIKLRCSFDAAAKVVTDTFEWKVDDNKNIVLEKPGYCFDSASVVFIILGIIVLITEWFEITNIGFLRSFIIVLCLALAVGYFIRFDMVEWFDIDEVNGIVLIQITKYDSSGYRNISEKEIFILIEKLKSAKLL